jgi:hypothetical protein
LSHHFQKEVPELQVDDRILDVDYMLLTAIAYCRHRTSTELEQQGEHDQPAYLFTKGQRYVPLLLYQSSYPSLMFLGTGGGGGIPCPEHRLINNPVS